MAPACEVGHPQRSLVRIPGSGSDKDMTPICLEIAQITSFLMTDTIPRYQLPPPEIPTTGTTTYNIFALRSVAPPPTTPITTDTAVSRQTVARKSLKRPLEDDHSDMPNKRNNSPEESESNNKSDSESGYKSDSEESESSNKSDSESGNKSDSEESESSNKSDSDDYDLNNNLDNNVDPRTRKIRLLLEDRFELKKENEELLLKVNKFKELLRDRTKLNEFLIAMKELKC